MSQLIKGLKNELQGTLGFGESTTKILAGVTGIASPVLELGSKVIHFFEKALGGGDAKVRRSMRLAKKQRINYSPRKQSIKYRKKSPKHLQQVVAHLKKTATTSKSPGRPKK